MHVVTWADATEYVLRGLMRRDMCYVGRCDGICVTWVDATGYVLRGSL